MNIAVWVLIAGLGLVGICHLALLIQAVTVTYQMLRGRHPNPRKGALAASAGVLGEAMVDTINLQSALDVEHRSHQHTGDPHDSIIE